MHSSMHDYMLKQMLKLPNTLKIRNVKPCFKVKEVEPSRNFALQCSPLDAPKGQHPPNMEAKHMICSDLTTLAKALGPIKRGDLQLS